MYALSRVLLSEALCRYLYRNSILCYFYPPAECNRGDMDGKDNDSYIFGGDIRLFDVSVDEENR